MHIKWTHICNKRYIVQFMIFPTQNTFHASYLFYFVPFSPPPPSLFSSINFLLCSVHIHFHLFSFYELATFTTSNQFAWCIALYIDKHTCVSGYVYVCCKTSFPYCSSASPSAASASLVSFSIFLFHLTYFHKLKPKKTHSFHFTLFLIYYFQMISLSLSLSLKLILKATKE